MWQVWELDGKNLRDSEQFKASHKKPNQNFSVDARILIALMRKQPQTRHELIKSANIGKTSFYRNIKLLIMREILKETSNGYAFLDFIEKPNRWSRVKNEFAKVDAKLVEIELSKAIEDGVDAYGHYKWSYNTRYLAKVIIVLRNAPDIIRIAKQFEISFNRNEFVNKVVRKEFAGVILTQGKTINFMDMFTWQNELYKIWDTEDIMDGYDFSYRIGYLEWIPK